MIVAGVVLLVASGIYQAVFSHRARSRRRLVGTRRTPSGQLHDGLARVTGKAFRGREILRAPASERPCLAFDLCVEVSHGQGWREVVRRQEACPFLLRDETGEVHIEPDGHIDLLLAEEVRGGTTWPARVPDPAHLSRVLALLEEHDLPRAGWFSEDKVRYFEGALLEGGLVSVYGATIEETRSEAERTGPRTLPVARVLRGTVEEPLRIGGNDVAVAGLRG